MPARLIVTLEPKVVHDDGPPVQTGPGMHAAVLHALRRLDPELSAAIHGPAPDDPRPLAVTPLLSGPRFEVGVLDDAIVGAVAEALDRTDELRIGHSSFFLTRIDVHQHAWAELLERAVPRRRWTLQFLTPTTFRARDTGIRRCQPLPSPELVFGQLLWRWASFADALLPDQTGAVVARHLAVEHLEGRTERHLVKAPAIAEVGFVGQVTYTVVAAREVDPEPLRGIDALTLLAMFSGVGDLTAKGMGYTRLMAGAAASASTADRTSACPGHMVRRMPQMQVCFPDEFYEQVKRRGRPSELLQEAVRAELRRQCLLADTYRYLTDLVAEAGEPDPEELARAEPIARRITGRAEPEDACPRRGLGRPAGRALTARSGPDLCVSP
ncbi:MAG: CRISPR system precrRNA processing endoribonuclease RAMP protein Cas6 [Egibacteraceae bacterium]